MKKAKEIFILIDKRLNRISGVFMPYINYTFLFIATYRGVQSKKSINSRYV